MPLAKRWSHQAGGRQVISLDKDLALIRRLAAEVLDHHADDFTSGRRTSSSRMRIEGLFRRALGSGGGD